MWSTIPQTSAPNSTIAKTATPSEGRRLQARVLVTSDELDVDGVSPLFQAIRWSDESFSAQDKPPNPD
jgi:hypothetical protein